jgi:adenosylcobinamide kinase/adenosylcobinamide-phosphate guanylyltransferase
MEARIKAHQASRPANWHTIEAPRQVAAAIEGQVAQAEAVLLDCVTLMAMNSYGMGVEEDVEAQAAAEATLMAEIEALIALSQQGQADWLVVSNEVGLGLVPPNPLGRAYRDALGRANQRLAQAADEVIFMVAGLPLWMKGQD